MPAARSRQTAHGSQVRGAALFFGNGLALPRSAFFPHHINASRPNGMRFRYRQMPAPLEKLPSNLRFSFSDTSLKNPQRKCLEHDIYMPFFSFPKNDGLGDGAPPGHSGMELPSSRKPASAGSRKREVSISFHQNMPRNQADSRLKSACGKTGLCG